jgi:hypothetical protein
MENTTNNLLSFSCLRIRVEKRPYCGAALLGIFLGVFGVLFSLLFITVLLRFLPMEQWGKSAAAGLTNLSSSWIFLIAVVYAPIFETFLGQMIPIELARRFRAHQVVCVILSGIVFGCGHFLNGGLVHGISTFLLGMVFASGYVTMRWAGIGPAFIASSTAHAVQNGTLIFIIAPVFPGLA